MKLPAGKTVKLKFLGTGMISVMPVSLLVGRVDTKIICRFSSINFT